MQVLAEKKLADTEKFEVSWVACNQEEASQIQIHESRKNEEIEGLISEAKTTHLHLGYGFVSDTSQAQSSLIMFLNTQTTYPGYPNVEIYFCLSPSPFQAPVHHYDGSITLF